MPGLGSIGKHLGSWEFGKHSIVLASRHKRASTEAQARGANRETVGKLALLVGKGCAELHDRRVVGIRVARIELDEVWSFVGEKQKRVERHEAFSKGDQYVFTALASTQKAIISYRVGKRDGSNTDDFVQDLRGRVLGSPEISTDGWASYTLSVRDAFRNSAHGVIVKTLAVTDLRKDAAHRYSPCEVVAVSREAVASVPAEISTSYVERSNLTVRMASRRFTRLTNGFSKKLEVYKIIIERARRVTLRLFLHRKLTSCR